MTGLEATRRHVTQAAACHRLQGDTSSRILREYLFLYTDRQPSYSTELGGDGDLGGGVGADANTPTQNTQRGKQILRKVGISAGH